MPTPRPNKRASLKPHKIHQSICLCAGVLLGATGLAGLLPTPAAANQAAYDQDRALLADLPKGALTVLSPADEKRYRRVFELQEKGDMAAASKVIGQLENDVLLGHVLAQRYLHPTAYRSQYGELRDWLALYRDHPQASRLYRLALARKPAGVPAPERARPRPWRALPSENIADPSPPPRSSRSAQQRVRTIRNRVIGLLRRERPTQALNYLQGASIRRQLTRHEYAYLRTRIAKSYFIENVDQKAYRLAAQVAREARSSVPQADWTAGLSAWRLGDYQAAFTHFSALGLNTNASQQSRSAGAYWAARASFRLDKPAEAVALWGEAAKGDTSFYGLLGARQLGRDLVFTLTLPPLSAQDLEAALAKPALARAAALAQVGRIAEAEQEFARAHGASKPENDPALLALAIYWKLPSGQLLVGEYNTNPGLRRARYPLPAFEPEGGYQLDQALLYALARQESRFRADAKSSRGARGLLQVMPHTAYHVTKDASFRSWQADRLLEPGLNLAIGQRYLEELMTRYNLRDNLFHLMVAYNGGPGNLRRWAGEMRYEADPLLFIESIPSRETRHFVEAVLTNYWMYRLRLDEPTPSLDALAAGGWPGYEPAPRRLLATK